MMQASLDTMEKLIEALRAKNAALHGQQNDVKSSVDKALTAVNVENLKIFSAYVKDIYKRMHGMIQSDCCVDKYDNYRDFIFHDLGTPFNEMFGPRKRVADDAKDTGSVSKKRKTTE